MALIPTDARQGLEKGIKGIKTKNNKAKKTQKYKA